MFTMPSADEILSALAMLSNKYTVVAILWHAIFVFLLLFSLFEKQKKPNQSASYILCLPLFSVSALAWLTGNLFNGMLFLLAAILLVALSIKERNAEVLVNSKWLKIIGVFVFLSGFFYPHFLYEGSWNYLYAAPIGIVPCPTLLTVTGFVLMFDIKQSKYWFVVLILLDVFYGLFGVFKLEIFLDLLLIAATIALAVRARLTRKQENQQLHKFMPPSTKINL
jgi:hypothetical protein